ncbi:hypothetical protein AB9K41_28355, partial [Cribrihabitans sp. XS_ASV171]
MSEKNRIDMALSLIDRRLHSVAQAGHSVTRMSDILAPAPLPRDGAAALAAAVPGPGFARDLLAYVRKAAEIANFGAFYVADIARAEPVLSVHSGEMSDYWFNRNARTILA